MAIKKNDNVIVLTGKDKGKTGKIEKVFPKENKVIIAGLNMFKKRQRPRRQGEKGQVIEMAMPIHISNVMLESDKKAKKGSKKAEPKAEVKAEKVTAEKVEKAEKAPKKAAAKK
jgi:large subunit ribosomal protein L24